MSMTKFNKMASKLAARSDRKRVAVVWAADSTTRDAVAMALSAGIIDAIFIGCKAEVEADPSLRRYVDHFDVIPSEDSDCAAACAVQLIREGKADIIMKGMLNTDNLLRAVLNKETGILRKGAVLTHVTASEIPAYGKLLLFTDPAVIPYPNDVQRHAQVEYLKDMAWKMGIDYPRIALIHCSEKVDPKHFPFTADYELLSRMSREDELGKCIVDGPMDVKTALSKAAMEKKGLSSPIDGYADALIFPDIEAANTFYKTISLFAEAAMAGMLVGADAPIVLPSRGDSVQSKYNSLILASL